MQSSKKTLGKSKRLELKPVIEGELYIGVKKDGGNYTVRAHKQANLTPEQWIKFYDQINRKQKVMFNFLIQLGCRVNEARHIRVEDIEMNAQYITIKKTKVRAKLGERFPQPRIVKVSSIFIVWVKGVIREFRLKPSDYFPILSTSWANRFFRIRLKQIGMKNYYMFTIHSIRKTHETWMLSLGVDMWILAKRLGHKKEMALDRYIQEDIFTLKQKQLMKDIMGDDIYWKHEV